MTKRTRIIDYFKFSIFVLFLYAFTFQIIISKYTYIGIELFMVAIFFMKYGINDFFKFLHVEIALLTTITLYSYFVDFLNSGHMVYLDRFSSCLLQGTAVSYCIARFVRRDKYLNKNFENAFVAIALIAGLITIGMLLSPSFDNFIKSYSPETFERLDERFEHRYRLYGLSENLSFTYPYVLAVISFYAIVKRNFVISLPLSILAIISITFNARIGFIPIFLSIVYVIFFGKKNVKDLLGYLIVIISIPYIYQYIISKNEVFLSEWGMTFFDEMRGLIKGEESDTYDALTGSHMFLPKDSYKDFIFGTGISVYIDHSLSGQHSDVGYVIQFYYGGLVLFVLIISLMIYMSLRVSKVLGIRHWYTFIYIISLFILNFKGFYFASTPGFRFLTLLYVYYLMDNIEENRNHKIVKKNTWHMK